jgi:hypothetical protein
LESGLVPIGLCVPAAGRASPAARAGAASGFVVAAAAGFSVSAAFSTALLPAPIRGADAGAGAVTSPVSPC